MVAPLRSPSPDIDAPDGLGSPADGGLAASWLLLHEAGDAIAGLARIDRAAEPLAPREFAMRAAAAGPARLALAEQAIDDCAAALHCGIVAMIAATEQGRDCSAAALTLWREFDRARRGLQALIAQPG